MRSSAKVRRSKVIAGRNGLQATNQQVRCSYARGVCYLTRKERTLQYTSSHRPPASALHREMNGNPRITCRTLVASSLMARHMVPFIISSSSSCRRLRDTSLNRSATIRHLLVGHPRWHRRVATLGTSISIVRTCRRQSPGQYSQHHTSRTSFHW